MKHSSPTSNGQIYLGSRPITVTIFESERFNMARFSALLAALLVGIMSTSALASEETVATTKSAPAESKSPTLAPDSITEGSVTAGGTQIAYQAVAGTITVGATDEQDAQLGPDGKPLPDTEAALNAAQSKD